VADQPEITNILHRFNVMEKRLKISRKSTKQNQAATHVNKFSSKFSEKIRQY